MIRFSLYCGLLAALFGGIASADQSATLQKIRATGVIAIGYREGSVPFSYLDDQHQPVGFSMDICNKVVVAIRQTRSPTAWP